MILYFYCNSNISIVYFLFNYIRCHYYHVITSLLTCHQNDSHDVFDLVERLVELNTEIKRLSAPKYGCWSIVYQFETVRVMFHRVFQRVQMSRDYWDCHYGLYALFLQIKQLYIYILNSISVLFSRFGIQMLFIFLDFQVDIFSIIKLYW